MKVEFAFFAKAGLLQTDGSFSVLEAGFDGIEVRQFPSVFPSFVLAFRLVLTADENRAYNKLKLQAFDPDELEVPGSSTDILVPLQEHAADKEQLGRFTCLANVAGLPITKPGAYRFRLSTNDREIVALTLQARQDPDPIRQHQQVTNDKHLHHA